MRPAVPLLMVCLLAACSGPASRGVDQDSGAFSSRAAISQSPGAPDGGAVSVTGHAENTFYGGAVLRDVRFSVQLLPDGTPEGNVEILLQGSDRFTGHPNQGGAPIRFAVTCLETDGRRAWIGGRSMTPGFDASAALGDVWYIEDGDGTGPDRVGVWNAHAPEACNTRPNVPWAAPVERGDLVVRAR